MQTRQSNADAGAELTRALEETGHRMTQSRRTVAALIAGRDGAFATADLVADSRRRHLGVARATIFRTLEVLVGLGAVERLDLPSGAHSYVRCESTRHHHHLVCTRCQRAVDLEDLGMTAIVAEMERRTGYKVARHRVELWGLCPACQAATSTGPARRAARAVDE
ncbi:MAG: transcriptional repressor [Candidatus Limnocylindrales bacterium]